MVQYKFIYFLQRNINIHITVDIIFLKYSDKNLKSKVCTYHKVMTILSYIKQYCLS